MTRFVAVFVAIIAAIGCDQIFGLKETRSWDAPPPPTDWPTSITYQTLPLGASGSSVGSFDPIPGLTVKVASIYDVPTGADVVAVPPTAIAGSADGSFLVPYKLGTEPYRVMFTAPDGTPTEIQSTMSGFHYTFPFYGPYTRTPVAGSATLALNFTGIGSDVGAGDSVRVLTTGVWAYTGNTAFTSGGASRSITIPYGSAASFTGPLGAPHAVAGEVEVALVRGLADADDGVAVFSADGLGAPVNVTWQSLPTTSVVLIGNNSTLNVTGRLTTNSQTGSTGTTSATRWFGVVPSTAMPNFATTDATGAMQPDFLPLAETNTNPVPIGNPFNGAGAPALSLAGYAADARSRTVSVGAASLTLPAAFQMIGLATAGSNGSDTVDLDYTVGMVPNNSGGPPKLGATPLQDGSGGPVAISLGTGEVGSGSDAFLPLTFSVDGVIDDCAVTLYRIDVVGLSAVLTPLARYIVTQSPAAAGFPVRIDSTYFQLSATMIFGFACELGRNSSGGDFRTVSYPYESSTIYSSTFTVTP